MDCERVKLSVFKTNEILAREIYYGGNYAELVLKQFSTIKVAREHLIDNLRSRADGETVVDFLKKFW